MAWYFSFGVVHAVRELLARGDLDLLLHQIDAVRFLGDGVLHLDAGVHLHEVVVPLVVHEELDRAGVLRSRLRCASFTQPSPIRSRSSSRHDRRRAFLDDLLVAPLHRAIALAEVHDVAVVVGHDLKLDVVRVLDQLLDVDAGVAERFFRLQPRARESPARASTSLCAGRMPRPPPPATALIITG